MSNEVKVEFKNERNMTLVGVFNKAQEVDLAPCVIICHPFTGFKELKHLHELAEILSLNGIHAFRFDFSDCIGESEGSCEDMKLTHQISDLKSAINFVSEQKFVDSEKIGAFGHSLGGLTIIATAAIDQRIKALVTLAAVAKCEWEHLFGPEKLKEWKEKGFIEINTPKGKTIKINYGFYHDLIDYDGTAEIKKIHAPIRIIHGDSDTITDIRNAEGLYKNAHEPKQLDIISGAGHMFSEKEERTEAIELALEWYLKYLV